MQIQRRSSYPSASSLPQKYKIGRVPYPSQYYAKDSQFYDKMPWETAVGESEMAELHPFRSAGGQMLEPGRKLDGPAAETGQLGSQKQVRIIHDYIFGLEALISLQFP